MELTLFTIGKPPVLAVLDTFLLNKVGAGVEKNNVNRGDCNARKIFVERYRRRG